MHVLKHNSILLLAQGRSAVFIILCYYSHTGRSACLLMINAMCREILKLHFSQVKHNFRSGEEMKFEFGKISRFSDFFEAFT